VTIYEAVDWDGIVRCEGKTQGECVKKARKYVESQGEGHLNIRVTKKLSEGKAHCAKVSYKPSSSERPGRYVFIGVART
jgi:hypothetical protein